MGEALAYSLAGAEGNGLWSSDGAAQNADMPREFIILAPVGG